MVSQSLVLDWFDLMHLKLRFSLASRRVCSGWGSWVSFSIPAPFCPNCGSLYVTLLLALLVATVQMNPLWRLACWVMCSQIERVGRNFGRYWCILLFPEIRDLTKLGSLSSMDRSSKSLQWLVHRLGAPHQCSGLNISDICFGQVSFQYLSCYYPGCFICYFVYRAEMEVWRFQMPSLLLTREGWAHILLYTTVCVQWGAYSTQVVLV